MSNIHATYMYFFCFFFDLDIFIGQLPPRRPHWSLALLLASGDQTTGAAGPSALTDGAEAHIWALFSPWAWKHNNSVNSKKFFRVKPKATNSSRLNLGPFPAQGDEFLVPV